jgi:dipeptidyl aminopeptidase/acylaminoacyl peptidase
MKKFILCSVFILVVASVIAQQSALLATRSLRYDDYPFSFRLVNLPDKKLKPAYTYLDSILVSEITYMSDGLKVKGLLVQPAAKGKYPCIIYNRGGNREYGNLKASDAFLTLGRLASKGFVVVASYYRGNGGSEGREEFGGADVNDVLNLIPVLCELPRADTARIGMYGWSRGGMMTYLALKKTHRIKAAVVGGAISDLKALLESRPEMESVYRDLIPGYLTSKKETLKERSAIYWPCEMNPVPLLIIHGSADKRVPASQSETLSNLMIACHPRHKLMLIPGADHGLSSFATQRDQAVLDWFTRYLSVNMHVAENRQ